MLVARSPVSLKRQDGAWGSRRAVSSQQLRLANGHPSSALLEPTPGRPGAGENPWASKQRNHGWFVLPPERGKQSNDINELLPYIITKTRVATAHRPFASSQTDNKTTHIASYARTISDFQREKPGSKAVKLPAKPSKLRPLIANSHTKNNFHWSNRINSSNRGTTTKFRPLITNLHTKNNFHWSDRIISSNGERTTKFQPQIANPHTKNNFHWPCLLYTSPSPRD